MVLRGKKIGLLVGVEVVGFDEGHPEVVLDHVQRYLAAAYRAFDIGHDRELGLVQHKPVAGVHRKLFEHGKGITGHVLVVARQLVHAVVGFQKQRAPSLHARGIQGVGHMPLVQDTGAAQLQAVVNALYARIVVGPAGGDDVYRFAGRRT